jgi:hypothetical protein
VSMYMLDEAHAISIETYVKKYYTTCYYSLIEMAVIEIGFVQYIAIHKV